MMPRQLSGPVGSCTHLVQWSEQQSNAFFPPAQPLRRGVSIRRPSSWRDLSDSLGWGGVGGGSGRRSHKLVNDKRTGVESEVVTCVVSAPHFSLDCLGNSRMSPEIQIKWTISRKPSWTCPALTWAHPQTAPTLCWPHLSVVEAEKQQENPTKCCRRNK